MVCCKRTGDVRKCIPFYIIAGILLLIGLPLMIVGIVEDFVFADLIGYIGGICILFGFGFLLMWYMFTVENNPRKSIEEYSKDLSPSKDLSNLSGSASEHPNVKNNSEGNKTASNGYSNLAFEGTVINTIYKNTEEIEPDGQVLDDESGMKMLEHDKIDETNSHNLDNVKHPLSVESNH